jgi:hypothetical protein
MLPRALLIGGLAALALPAAASAATLSTSTTEAVYQAAAGDRVEVQVYAGWDDDLHSTAVYFLPVNQNPTDPTTSDPACWARPAGASSCALTLTRTRTRLQLAGEPDFVGVTGASDTVEAHLGEGNDRLWTTGSKVVAYGDGGDDSVQGGPGLDRLDGGAGDDTLDPYSFGDAVHGGPGFDTVRYTGNTEPVIVTLDDTANDGRRATTAHGADNQDVRADVEQVIGGTSDDQLEGDPNPNTLRGGDGADTLSGNGGADTLRGDAGDDTVNARDGVADVIDCGPGADTAIADAADTTTSCETVQLPAAPPAPPADAPATPGPGPVPTAAPPAKVGATVVGRWGLGRRATTVFELAVKQIPAGGRVEVRCSGKGCPFARRTVAARRGAATLTKLFARRKLRRGAVLEVRITAPGMVGKVVRYTMRARRKLPRSAPLCLPPGATRPAAC